MNDVANAEMIEFWNSPTADKWILNQDMMDLSLEPLGQKAMEAAAISAGERVIDIGCGCGGTSLDLARRVGSAGYILGVDVSKPMLEHARTRAAKITDAASAPAVFELGDAQTHVFEPAAFDLVFSRFGVMFFDDPVAAFGNLKSALKPGGRVAFACWQPAKNNPWIKMPMAVVTRHVPRPTPSAPNEPGEFGFGDPARVAQILDDAGFADITVENHVMPFSMGTDGDIDETIAFLMNMGPTSRAIIQGGADEALKSRITDDLREALAPYDKGNAILLDAANWIVTARKPS